MREINGYQRGITDLNNQIKNLQQAQKISINQIENGYNSQNPSSDQEAYFKQKINNLQNESSYPKETPKNYNSNENFLRKDKNIFGPETNKLDVSHYYNGNKNVQSGNFSSTGKDQRSLTAYDIKSPIQQEKISNKGYGYKSPTLNSQIWQDTHEQDQNLTHRKNNIPNHNDSKD